MLANSIPIVAPFPGTLKDYVARAQAQLVAKASRKRSFKTKDKQMFETAIEAIICDLVACHLSGDGLLIVCRSDAKLYGPATKRSYSDLERSRQFGKVLDALECSPSVAPKTAMPWKPKPGQKLTASTIYPSDHLVDEIIGAAWTFDDIAHVAPDNPPELLILKRRKDGYWDAAEPVGWLRLTIRGGSGARWKTSMPTLRG